jgi:hypothetical protein
MAQGQHKETTKFCLWSLFFGVAAVRAALGVNAIGRGPASQIEGETKRMKKLSVVIAGSGQIRDVEIEPGTTAGDVLHQLNLEDSLLSKGPKEPFFAAAESIYDKVKNGEKIFASTKTEVGVLPLCT